MALIELNCEAIFNEPFTKYSTLKCYFAILYITYKFRHKVLIICSYFKLVFCKSDSETSMIHQPQNPAAHPTWASSLGKSKSIPEQKLLHFLSNACGRQITFMIFIIQLTQLPAWVDAFQKTLKEMLLVAQNLCYSIGSNACSEILSNAVPVCVFQSTALNANMGPRILTM